MSAASISPNPCMLAVLGYLASGWQPVYVATGKKEPVRKGWQNVRYTAATAAERWKTPGNVGLLLGEPSGGLVDVDLDSAEAMAAADAILPATPGEFGYGD